MAPEERRHWLEGLEQPFLISKDHKKLEYLRTAKRLNNKQARWALLFTRLNFTLSYRLGSEKYRTRWPLLGPYISLNFITRFPPSKVTLLYSLLFNCFSKTVHFIPLWFCNMFFDFTVSPGMSCPTRGHSLWHRSERYSATSLGPQSVCPLAITLRRTDKPRDQTRN